MPSRMLWQVNTAMAGQYHSIYMPYGILWQGKATVEDPHKLLRKKVRKKENH